MLKKYTKYLDTNIYLNAAEALGFEIEIIDYNNSFANITYKNKKLYIYENWLSLNDQVSYAFAKNKFVSGEILKKVVPNLIPETILISLNKFAIQTAVDFSLNHNFAIVIKPNSGSLGIDVYIQPKTIDEVKKICQQLLAKYDEVIVQKLLTAVNEYRIVYVNGEFFDAIRRIPAYVTGDNKSSVKELIIEKNKTKLANDFPIISIDETLEEYLFDQNYELGSILPNGKHLQLKKVCSFSQGGEGARVSKEHFHPIYLDAFKKAAEISRLNFIGIDLMSNDISKIPTKNDGINEINSAPMVNVHYAADLLAGESQLFSAKKLLSRILG